MDGYIKDVFFNIPGAFEKRDLLEPFIKAAFPEDNDILKDNVHIASVYGSPYAIWNGGRNVGPFLNFDESELKEIRDFYNDKGISIRFTFSNSLIKEEHLYDEYCNKILEIYANGINEITCASDLLENYIRNKFSNSYRFISSTSKRLDKTNQQSEFDKDYYLICIDYDLNKDFTFLNSIDDKSRIELLANAICGDNCPYRKEHYRMVSEAQLGIPIIAHSGVLNCPHSTNSFYQIKGHNNFISDDNINYLYLPNGINHIKLEGRSNPSFDYVDILLYYLVKDKHKDRIRKAMLFNHEAKSVSERELNFIVNSMLKEFGINSNSKISIEI